MRLPSGIVIWFWVVFCCAAAFPQHASAGNPQAAGLAALVNGAVITADAFHNEVQRMERLLQRGKVPSGNAGAAVKKQALENLIVRELLYQEGVRRGMRVSEAEVAAELSLLKKQLPGEALFEAALDRMGVTASDLKTQLRKGIVIQKFIDRDFGANMSVSDNDVVLYYQAHPGEFMEPMRLRISHILVKIDPSWNAEAKEEGRARIEAARDRLIVGEDFALVARENSDCFSAKSGGDLGYFLPGQLSKRMEDEARALKPGGVSGIVEDRYGLHLLKLTELRPASQAPLESVRRKIRQDLIGERKLKVPASFQKRLRAEAKVEILLNEDAL